MLTWETSSQMIIVVAKPWWRCYESLMIMGWEIWLVGVDTSRGKPLKLLRIGAKLRSIYLNENQKRFIGKVGTLIIKWHWLSDGGHNPTTYLHLNRGCRLIF